MAAMGIIEIGKSTNDPNYTRFSAVAGGLKENGIFIECHSFQSVVKNSSP